MGGFGGDDFAGVVVQEPCPDTSVRDFLAEQEQERVRAGVVLAFLVDGSTLPTLSVSVMASKILVYCPWKSRGSIAVRSP